MIVFGWYCKYGISYRDHEGMMLERGVEVDHTRLYRRVQKYAPEIKKGVRWFWKPSMGRSWQVDETYVKVKGKWMYPYRVIDIRGYAIDFYLSATCNAKAAKRFLSKALKSLKAWAFPITIYKDKASACTSAIVELKSERGVSRGYSASPGEKSEQPH